MRPLTIILVIDHDSHEARRVVHMTKSALHGKAAVSIVTAGNEQDAIDFLAGLAARETRVPVALADAAPPEEATRKG